MGKSKAAVNKLKIVEEDVTRTTHDRNEIESMLIDHNRKHFNKALKTEAYDDKIIRSLKKEKVRDKILKGEIRREDVDNEDVFEFLKLLEIKDKTLPTKTFNPINMKDWRIVVKGSNKNSVSSVFSQRTYVVYKLVVDNEEFMDMLIMFYNLAIAKGIVLNRWRYVLDTMLDKGKGLVLGKLRIIELIEGDLQLIIRMYAGLRNNVNIKKDSRLSNFNFGSRQNYSIESVFLEKD